MEPGDRCLIPNQRPDSNRHHNKNIFAVFGAFLGKRKLFTGIY